MNDRFRTKLKAIKCVNRSVIKNKFLREFIDSLTYFLGDIPEYPIRKLAEVHVRMERDDEW